MLYRGTEGDLRGCNPMKRCVSKLYAFGANWNWLYACVRPHYRSVREYSC
ncbi:hypothetical protein JG688_00016738 [Phytophthora aleatoria]|uniref:Uncharacterized protein n=1 Tax=Phytophthora aleatoria TaxID=2496075 RepID=A0A8J5MCP0_9STRA|nr:hypothetical protein JG688_00016738 [Phytophthora aleatoria]